LGCDVAGVVETVGENVTAFRPGDRVFGDMYPFGLGAFGEYVAAPQKAFASIPDEMSFEDAATLPHSACLALNGLRLRNGRTVQPGDKVLIDGASGSVGPFAVQIAKSLGAEVTGVCSTAKVEFVRSLGADRVIDYTKVDYTSTGERFDWILAVDAHHSIFRVRRSLRPNGVYTTLGGPTARLLQALVVGPLISLAGTRSMGLVYWWRPFSPDDVVALKALVAAGVLTPAIERRIPLGEVVAALRHVEDGHAQGKVVITV
jgi:NADPH:quinone reductase-like Zn-dependent oxidoreductase